MGVGEIRRMNKATGKHEVMATGIYGDGIAYSGFDEYYVVSEWGGRILVIGNDTVQSVLDTSEKLNESGKKINSADFGYNLEKKILYVPTFFDNRIVAYELKAE